MTISTNLIAIRFDFSSWRASFLSVPEKFIKLEYAHQMLTDDLAHQVIPLCSKMKAIVKDLFLKLCRGRVVGNLGVQVESKTGFTSAISTDIF